VTEHLTVEWTQQQFRMVAGGNQPHRLLIHERDSVFSPAIDEMLTSKTSSAARKTRASVQYRSVTGALAPLTCAWKTLCYGFRPTPATDASSPMS
jgi:hypothetical protein